MAPILRTPPPSTNNSLIKTQCRLCVLPENDKMVLCDGPCKSWFHLDCVMLTEEQAQALNVWLCNQCNERISAYMMSENQEAANNRDTSGANFNNQKAPSVRSIHSKSSSRNSQSRRERLERREELLRLEQDILRREKLLHEKGQQILEEREKLSDEESLKSCFDLISFNHQVQNHPINQRSVDKQVQDNILRKRATNDQHQCREKFQPEQMNSCQIPEVTTNQMLTRHSIGKELPIFSGRPEEWAIFISAFEHSTSAMGFTNYENLMRLQKSLKGKARETVESQLSLPSCVPKIIDTLRMIFGRPELVMHSQIEKIRHCQLVKADKLETIVDFSTAIQNLCATLEATNLYEYDYNPLFMTELVEKLPPNLKLEWARYSENLNKPGITSFGEWLQDLANYVNRVMPIKIFANNNSNKSVPDKKLDQSKNKIGHLNVHFQENSDQDANDVNVCRVCKGKCLDIEKCTKFIEMRPYNRWKIIKQLKICKLCLKHKWGTPKKCPKPMNCNKTDCKLNHHPLLHDDKQQSNYDPTS